MNYKQKKRHSNPTWAKHFMHIFLTGGKIVKSVKIPKRVILLDSCSAFISEHENQEIKLLLFRYVVY